MRLSTESILGSAKLRDQFIFLSYALLITAVFQLSIYSFMRWDVTRITLCIVMVAQFYLTAFVRFPIQRKIWRKISYILFHLANFVIFREVILAFTPNYIESTIYFLPLLILFFLLVLIGRDIRMYAELARQLNRLERWTERKMLFEKPESIRLHLGEPGEQDLHPNEILYIRTRAAGDHTKVFGIKSSTTGLFREYETAAYANFNEIGKKLAPFPQFKRISQSVVLNHKYPFEEKNGVIHLEGRRFSISKKFK